MNPDKTNLESERGYEEPSRIELERSRLPYSAEISATLVERVAEQLEVLGKQHGFGAAIWGSLARGEMTPSSDIDLICYYARGDAILDANQINSHIDRTTNANRRVDTIVFDGTDLISGVAAGTGTNAHSVYFATRFIGDTAGVESLKAARECLKNNSTFRVREFFNCFTSSKGLSQIVNRADPLWSKLSPEGTNKWVRLALAAQLRWPELIGTSTREVLRILDDITGDESGSAVEAWDKVLSWRREVEQADASLEAPEVDGIYNSIASKFLVDSAPWIQRDGGVSSQLLSDFITRITGEAAFVPEKKTGSEEIERFLRAFCSTDPAELLELSKLDKPNWWLATALTTNQHTPAEALDRLAFPDFKIAPIAWQTIRLYVAKSKQTSKQTLLKILNYPGLREQDYVSAENNLRSRF